MCWSEIGEIIKAVAPVFTAGAAVGGVIIAASGLNQWKKVTIGKRRIELAEEVLAGFYEARDIIQDARRSRPAQREDNTRTKDASETEQEIFPDEQAKVAEFFEEEVSAPEDLTEEEIRKFNNYSAVEERLSEKAEFFAQLEKRHYRFIAYFGANAVEPYKILKKIRRDIKDAVDNLCMPDSMTSPEDILRYERTIWRRPVRAGDRDHIADELDEMIKNIEDICGPAIQKALK